MRDRLAEGKEVRGEGERGKGAEVNHGKENIGNEKRVE